jgi:Putative phage abortive infection protein
MKKNEKKIAISIVIIAFFGLFAVNYWLQSGGIRGYNGLLLAELIYAITAIIIVWYAIETAEIRMLEQQNMEQREKQNFEETFFQMLRLHNEIVNSITIQGVIINVGRESFVYLCKQLQLEYNIEINKFMPKKTEEDIEFVNRISGEFFSYYLQHIGHYFRNLYNIIKFIDKSNINDKIFYTNLVRAQLSTDELHLLFFNCLSNYGNEKFKPLIEKYALLKNIEKFPLINANHNRFYAISAFSKTSK